MIDHARVSAYTIPTQGVEGDGTLHWKTTTMVVVELEASGVKAVGYTYSHAACAKIIHDTLFPLLKKADPLQTRALWLKMRHETRNLGVTGVVASSIAAVDTALWDLRARLLKQPLVSLFGAVRDGTPVYGSGGFTTYTKAQLQKQLGDWVEDGFRWVKMKIGEEPARDQERMRQAREVIGPDTGLFIDANGAFRPREALAFAKQAADFNVTWFEEPVVSDDLEGLKWLRDRMPTGMTVAAGEYGYDPLTLKRMSEFGAVDTLQADVTRCQGFTGFMQVAEFCDIAMQPLSAHCAPTLHQHVCAAATQVRHIEYFHDHARIEEMAFDGFKKPVRGKLVCNLSTHGMGLSLKAKDIEKFKV